MTISVNDRVIIIATFRFIEVRLMELVARWTPTTAEMEVKIMFGRHIWDFAQHADALGKRTFELRRPEQYSVRPLNEYVQLLDQIGGIDGTPERIAALYDGILPGLKRRYEHYVAETDKILDEPSIVIIDRIAADLARQRRDADAVRKEIAVPAVSAEAFARNEAALSSIVAGEGRPA